MGFRLVDVGVSVLFSKTNGTLGRRSVFVFWNGNVGTVVLRNFNLVS